jgi:hypothetical protein
VPKGRIPLLYPESLHKTRLRAAPGPDAPRRTLSNQKATKRKMNAAAHKRIRLRSAEASGSRASQKHPAKKVRTERGWSEAHCCGDQETLGRIPSPRSRRGRRGRSRPGTRRSPQPNNLTVPASEVLWNNSEGPLISLRNLSGQDATQLMVRDVDAGPVSIWALPHLGYHPLPSGQDRTSLTKPVPLAMPTSQTSTMKGLAETTDALRSFECALRRGWYCRGRQPNPSRRAARQS